MFNKQTVEADTRERILDAAELLFSEQGYEAMSMRAVTAQAGVNLAAVNYHFGSKHDLCMEMLRRRIEPINRKRLEMLASVRADYANQPLPLRPIVEALIKPLIDAVEDSNCVHLFQMVGRCLTAPAQLDRDIFNAFFHDLVRVFIDALSEALPGVPPAVVQMRFHFMVSAALGVMVRMERILMDAENSEHEARLELDDVAEALCAFLTSALTTASQKEACV